MRRFFARFVATASFSTLLLTGAGAHAEGAGFSACSGEPRREVPAEGTDAHLLRAEKRRVRAVTVTLPERSCAGSIVGSPTQVLTAAHCIPENAELVQVRFGNRRLEAMVALIDRTRDTALLALDEALPVEPLELESELPEPGERILFVGRVDRPSRTQVAHILRLGSCPSLPGVSDALFTSVRARPGDSGAPLLDEQLRVVGIIHGGAACHIAAPVAALAQQLKAKRLAPAEGLTPSDAVRASAAPAPDDTPPVRGEVLDRSAFGPFSLEKVRNGDGDVRVRLRFRLGTSD